MRCDFLAGRNAKHYEARVRRIMNHCACRTLGMSSYCGLCSFDWIEVHHFAAFAAVFEVAATSSNADISASRSTSASSAATSSVSSPPQHESIPNELNTVTVSGYIPITSLIVHEESIVIAGVMFYSSSGRRQIAGAPEAKSSQSGAIGESGSHCISHESGIVRRVGCPDCGAC